MERSFLVVKATCTSLQTCKDKMKTSQRLPFVTVLFFSLPVDHVSLGRWPFLSLISVCKRVKKDFKQNYLRAYGLKTK